MSLNRLAPYGKLKELQGVEISKDFKISNIYPLDRVFNSGIPKVIEVL